MNADIFTLSVKNLIMITIFFQKKKKLVINGNHIIFTPLINSELCTT